jgi:hypothetical protein
MPMEPGNKHATWILRSAWLEVGSTPPSLVSSSEGPKFEIRNNHFVYLVEKATLGLGILPV